MNKGEMIALKWLKEQGYTNIIFNGHSTPDFTTDNGDFEVKRLANKVISFTNDQFSNLKQMSNIFILVVNDSGVVAHFPFSDICGVKIFNGIIIRQTPRLVRLHPETLERLEALRNFWRETPDDLVIKALRLLTPVQIKSTQPSRRKR